MMAKYLATSLAIENVVSAPRRDQQLLADLDDLDKLGRVGIQIDHVASLARGLRAGLHGDTDIGLSQRRRIVRAVAAHGDQAAVGLFLANIAQLIFRRRLRRGNRQRRLPTQSLPQSVDCRR